MLSPATICSEFYWIAVNNSTRCFDIPFSFFFFILFKYLSTFLAFLSFSPEHLFSTVRELLKNGSIRLPDASFRVDIRRFPLPFSILFIFLKLSRSSTLFVYLTFPQFFYIPESLPYSLSLFASINLTLTFALITEQLAKNPKGKSNLWQMYTSIFSPYKNVSRRVLFTSILEHDATLHIIHSLLNRNPTIRFPGSRVLFLLK